MGFDGQMKRQDAQYRATLRAIEQPVTSGQAGDALKIGSAACQRRLSTLRKAGLAKWSGRNEHGRWQITPAGRAALASGDLIALGARQPEPQPRKVEAPVVESALWVLMVGSRLPGQVTGRFVDRMQMSAAE